MFVFFNNIIKHYKKIAQIKNIIFFYISTGPDFDGRIGAEGSLHPSCNFQVTISKHTKS